MSKTKASTKAAAVAAAPVVPEVAPVKKSKISNLKTPEFIKEMMKTLVEEQKLLRRCYFLFGKNDKKDIKIRDEVYTYKSVKERAAKADNRMKVFVRNYEAVYKHCLRRRKSKPGHTNLPFRSLSRYQDKLPQFMAEAAKTNPAFASFASLVCVSRPDFYGITSPNQVTQVLTIYMLVCDLQNPKCGQMVHPDALMLKYFGEEIDRAIKKQQAKHDGTIYDKKTKPPVKIGFDAATADAIKYPGQLRFCNFQVLSTYLLKKQEETEESLAFLANEDNNKVIDNEIDMLRGVRLKVKAERAAAKGTLSVKQSSKKTLEKKKVQDASKKKATEKRQTLKKKAVTASVLAVTN
jgi:hypothetical protein